MKTAIVVAITIAGLAVGVAAQQGGGADEKAVAALRASYEKAANAQDAAAIAATYTVDGVEMPPNMPAVKGRAAIEAFHKQIGAMVTIGSLKLTPTSTKVTGDTGYDVGTYMQTNTPKGGKPGEDRGKYVVILKKAGGAWLVAYAIYNSDLPPPSATSAK